MSASPKFEGMKLQRDLARANVAQLRAERDDLQRRLSAASGDKQRWKARAEKAEAANALLREIAAEARDK